LINTITKDVEPPRFSRWADQGDEVNSEIDVQRSHSRKLKPQIQFVGVVRLFQILSIASTRLPSHYIYVIKFLINQNNKILQCCK